MEKAYVAEIDNLDTSYYTYSYYGVDSAGNRKLEAVALRRLNDSDVTIPAALRPQVANKNLLESEEYLTEANWNAYRQSFGLTGTVAFTDANVSTFIAAQFNQTMRTDITPPLVSGLQISHRPAGSASADYTARVDIQSLTDDAGFLLPRTIAVNRVTDHTIHVASTYVREKVAGTERTVTYDSVTGLNLYGLWFGSFEDAVLNINNTTDLISNTVNVQSSRYLISLAVSMGGGDDIIDVGRQTPASPTWLVSASELSPTLNGHLHRGRRRQRHRQGGQ
jgi:hypothetical protein